MSNYIKKVSYSVRYRELLVANLIANRQVEISVYILIACVVAQTAMVLAVSRNPIEFVAIGPAVWILFYQLNRAQLVLKHPLWRSVTIELTPQLVANITDYYVQLIQWKRVRQVGWRAGMIVIDVREDAIWFIPVRSFKSIEEAKEFFRTAQDLWRAAQGEKHGAGKCIAAKKKFAINAFGGWTVATLVAMVFCAMHLPIEASATVFLAAWGWEIHSLRGKKAHERAQLAFAKKDFDGALKASKEAVTADPNDVSFLKSRAWGEILTCQFEECQRTIDEAMARAREEDDDVAADELTMIQAELYCCGHRFEETRPLLNRLYQSMLWAGYAYLLRAEIDIVEKDLGKALEALRKAEQHRLQAPGLAQKLRLEALVHLLKGDLDEAEDKINDATKASPESPAFATKALILWKQGKLSEALAAADKAIELTTYYAEACWIRSQLRTISGDSAGAAKDGARAAQLRYKPYLEHLFEVPKREETTTHA